MDLSHIKLASTQEAMVDRLAENAHNVWARDRIRQGWTYGIQQVTESTKRFYLEGFSLQSARQSELEETERNRFR